jgi:hypothetical protein
MNVLRRTIIGVAANFLLALSCSAQQSAEIDTASAWTCCLISGYDAIAEVITAPAGGATLYAFDFFAVPSTQTYAGGIFEWDSSSGTVIGSALATIAGRPPANPSSPLAPTIPGTQIRFKPPSGVQLVAGHTYLLYINSTLPREFSPSWLVIADGYLLHSGKSVFPPNGAVTGSWTDIHVSSIDVTADWAFRAYFHDPDIASAPAQAVPSLSIGALVLLCLFVLATALLSGAGRIMRNSGQS